MLSISGPGRYLGCIVRGIFQLLVVVASMSCSSRVKKSQQQGRRLSNTDAAGMKKNNSRRSLLGESLAVNPAAWFHNSLQHLSHSWHKFNKFAISRDKKADRCSTWFVEPDNNNKTIPFFSRSLLFLPGL